VGLDRFSVRELARRLQVFPTAVYWHVGSKSRLLSLAAGGLIAEVQTAAPTESTWEATLSDIAHQIRTVMHRHPNFSSIFGAEIGVDLTPSMPLAEAILSALASAGFDDDEMVPAYNAYTGAVLGWVSIELSKAAASVGADVNWEESVAKDLRSLDPARYPHTLRLAPALADRAFMTRWTSGRSNPLDRSFEKFLDILIAGLSHELRTGQTSEASDTAS